MEERIEKLKELVETDLIYKEYLYDEEDDRPLNEVLNKNGFKPIGELKIKMKDILDENYEECQGKTYIIAYFSTCGGEIIICAEDFDGEFDFGQVAEII